MLELVSGEALVADQDQAGAQRVIAAGVGEEGGSYLAFPIFGLARHQAAGIPSGVAITYSFSPQ